MNRLWLAVVVFAVVGCGDAGSGAGSASPSAKPAASTPKPTATTKASAAPTTTAATSASAAPSAATSADAAPASDAIKKMLEDVQANEATYKDKPVKVDGLYMNSNEATANGKKSYNVVIVDSKEDKDNTLTCDLGDKAPEKLDQWTPVTIEGKGDVSNVTKGDKKMKSLRLKDCKVTKK